MHETRSHETCEEEAHEHQDTQEVQDGVAPRKLRHHGLMELELLAIHSLNQVFQTLAVGNTGPVCRPDTKDCDHCVVLCCVAFVRNLLICS